jgi:hypothetical protein
MAAARPRAVAQARAKAKVQAKAKAQAEAEAPPPAAVRRSPPPRPVSSVTLGPLRAAHAPAIVRWLRDPAVGANLGLRAQPTLARTRAFIADAAAAAAAPPAACALWARAIDRKSTRLNSSHNPASRMPSSA